MNIKQSGLSLIELMIAITLGAFIIIGAMQAYLGSRQASSFADGISYIQENSRFIFDEINGSIRQAGDMGCPGSMVRNTNSLVGVSLNFNSVVKDDLVAGDTWFTNFYHGVEGVAGATAGAVGAFLDGKIPKVGSDVLVIHKIDPSTLSSVIGHAPPTFTTDTHTYEISVGATSRDPILAVANDCLTASLFMMTGGTATTVTHGTAAVGDYENCVSNLGSSAVTGSVSCANSQALTFSAGSTLAKVTTAAYFVDTNDNLKRLSAGDSIAEELVEDVERMILKFGIDTDDDGVANQYKATGVVTAAEWVDVVTVRIGLIMKTDTAVLDTAQSITCNDATASASDRFLRKCILSTVNIRNRGGQNI